MNVDTPVSAQAASDLVPIELPPARTDTPAPVRTVRGLFALPGMIGLWVAPKFFGVRLAAAGWHAAIAAHVLAWLFGAGYIVWAENYPRQNPFYVPPRLPSLTASTTPPPIEMPDVEWSELLRGPIIALAASIHSAGVGATIGPGGLLIAGAIEAGLLALAVLMMPYAAAGERTGPLFGRSLRLTLWATTLAIPLGIGWLVSPMVFAYFHVPWEWSAPGIAALYLIGLWFLVILLRGGMGYAGPPEGPAWEPRTPRCEGCGYAIAAIPRTTNCPECGKPVADSLPENRRPPPFVGSSRRVSGTARAFFLTLWQTLRDPKFFSRLAIHTHHAEARSYFIQLSLLNAAVITLLIPILSFAHGAGPISEQLLDVVAGGGIFFCALFVIHVILAGSIAILDAAICRRSVHCSAVVAFYGMSAIVPAGLGVMAFFHVVSFALIAYESEGMAILMWAVTALLVPVLAICILTALGCLWRAIRHTKLANA